MRFIATSARTQMLTMLLYFFAVLSDLHRVKEKLRLADEPQVSVGIEKPTVDAVWSLEGMQRARQGRHKVD